MLGKPGTDPGPSNNPNPNLVLPRVSGGAEVVCRRGRRVGWSPGSCPSRNIAIRWPLRGLSGYLGTRLSVTSHPRPPSHHAPRAVQETVTSPEPRGSETSAWPRRSRPVCSARPERARLRGYALPRRAPREVEAEENLKYTGQNSLLRTL